MTVIERMASDIPVTFNIPPIKITGMVAKESAMNSRAGGLA